MSTIKFRKSSFYFHTPGSVQYYIDGQQQTPYFEGTTEIIEVGPGYHTLSVKYRWISSPELQINIRYNETKTFEVGVTKAIRIFSVIFVLINTPLNFQAAILPSSNSSLTIFLFLVEFGLIANLQINRSSIKALL